MIRRTAALLALSLALASCKGGEKPAAGAQAAGEVLPGSASDAMIPLDTVRSQPPLAPPPTGKPGAKGGKDEEVDATATDAADEDASAIAVPPPPTTAAAE